MEATTSPPGTVLTHRAYGGGGGSCYAAAAAVTARRLAKCQTAAEQLETIIKTSKEQPHLAAALAKHEGFKVKIEAAVVLKNDCT